MLRILAQPDRFLAADAYSLTFKRRIHEHHARDVSLIAEREVSDHNAAVRVAHQNEGTMLTKLGKGIVKFEIELGKSSWLRPGVAPGVAGSIVGAYSGEGRDLRLDQIPVKGKVSKAILDNDRRTTLAGAIHVEATPTEIHEFARRLGCGESLSARRREQRRDERDQ